MALMIVGAMVEVGKWYIMVGRDAAPAPRYLRTRSNVASHTRASGQRAITNSSTGTRPSSLRSRPDKGGGNSALARDGPKVLLGTLASIREEEVHRLGMADVAAWLEELAWVTRSVQVSARHGEFAQWEGTMHQWRAAACRFLGVAVDVQRRGRTGTSEARSEAQYR
ncbi:hypothetical protein SYNPS1DRAFT_28294 [Syncephalis pseudoplumigaleata]|uniref:Uncharacterized protein n=1 Tax=Syncephalis pseudoplumigaleata TaxID=1712513 RepID=A0A4P9Z0P3_9FUNG|nr:hypothetical protein SYNPS1DRAFT_28294 [Syncephalis pseudoplumigaleata]|eukprot:RKP25986.1 hypothetical protein SYNPS1DRAFT_28294 [Syncephalis pseudoplumigaleata]